jgi:type VI secretion system protein ImpJ
MSRTHRVLWGEGVFLRPQHFQQQERFLEARIAQGLAAAHAHAWGVREARLDPEALAAGSLSFEQLSLVFQDGTPFDAPREEPLPLPRNLGDLPGLGPEPMVYACLPLLNDSGGNSREAGTDAGRPVRFHLERTPLPDLHTDALEADVTVLRANVRTLLAEEGRDGHCALPVARLRQNPSGAWCADGAYLPPALALQGAPPLLGMLRALLDRLQAKSRALAGSHRERSRTVAEYGTADVASFWLLHSVNRSFPLLSHLLAFPQAHPEDLYQALAQLAAELLTFSTSWGLEDLPAYRHEDLAGTFHRLETLIRELLDTVISTRFTLIPLREVRPSFHIGHLESDRLGADCDFYLSVCADRPAAEVIETVPPRFKVGSPDDVDRILNSALPGVRLAHVTRTPAAVPVRIGNHYFALEPQGPIYERMLKARSICIYVPQGLPPMDFELVAVFP